MLQKTDSVTVKFGEETKNPDGSMTPQKEFTQTYSWNFYENADDILSALQDKEKTIEVLTRLNAAMKVNAQVSARNKIMAEQAAPEIAFEKQVKAFMKSRELNGKPVSLDKARQIITALNEAE